MGAVERIVFVSDVVLVNVLFPVALLTVNSTARPTSLFRFQLRSNILDHTRKAISPSNNGKEGLRRLELVSISSVSLFIFDMVSFLHMIDNAFDRCVTKNECPKCDRLAIYRFFL